MSKIQLTNPVKNSVVFVCVTSLLVLGMQPRETRATPLVQAQMPENNRSLAAPIFALPPLPKTGAPRGQRDASGRSGCESTGKPLTALTPIYPDTQAVFGLTTVAHPTFWFYVPYRSTTRGKLLLEDESNQQITYNIPLTKAPGVIQIALPVTAPGLQVKKLYRWYFNVYCQDELISDVQGVLQRESLNASLKSRLDKAPLSDRLSLFAANGIWYDALTTAAELRRLNPQDPSWAALLQAVGLEGFAQEQIVECCQPTSL